MPLPFEVHIIDDEPEMRQSLLRLLGAYDVPARAFGSAKEWLHEGEGAPIGCLVLDVRLGDECGLELLKRVHTRKNCPPAVMISGHAAKEDSDLATRYGAVAFFEKPFDAVEFVETVKRVMANQRRLESVAVGA